MHNPEIPDAPETPESRKALRGEPSSHGTRLTACLKMAGDPPVAQVSKVASAWEFKDNNDHKDSKDAQEGASCALAQRAQGNMRPSAQHWEPRDGRVMGRIGQMGHMGPKAPECAERRGIKTASVNVEM